MRKSLMVELSLVLLLILSMAIGQWAVKSFQDENAVLKAEIVEWQRAMLPAYYARYPEARTSPLPMDTETFSPDLLKRVLNPCWSLTGGSNVGTEECQTAIADASSYGSRSIPIKIIVAR